MSQGSASQSPASVASPVPTRAPLALPPWRRRRLAYLRAIAVVLLVSGLWQCAYALGGFTIDGRTFLEMRGPVRNAIAAFAVLDLVAAVGLWLGAVWGPVLFAIDVIAIIALRNLATETHGSAVLLDGLWIALVAGFVALSVVVHIEGRGIDARRRDERKANRRRPQTPA